MGCSASDDGNAPRGPSTDQPGCTRSDLHLSLLDFNFFLLALHSSPSVATETQKTLPGMGCFMAKGAGNSMHVSSLFWDGFEAAQAIADLAQSGFSSEDVPAFDALTGRIPYLDGCLLAMGLTPSESAYFAECFDEGEVLLVVHAHRLEQRNVAVRLLRRRGGVMATDCSSLPMENRGVL